MKEIDIVDSKEAKVDEFSTADSVLKTYETTLSVYETDLKVVDDVTGFAEKKVKKIRQKAKGKQADKQLKSEDFGNLNDDFINYSSSDSKSGQVSAFGNENKSKSTLAEHSDSAITDNVNVIGGDVAVLEDTPNILSYDEYSLNKIIRDSRKSNKENARQVRKQIRKALRSGAWKGTKFAVKTTAKATKETAKLSLKVAERQYETAVNQAGENDYVADFAKGGISLKRAYDIIKKNIKASIRSLKIIKRSGCAIVAVALVAVFFVISSFFLSGAIKTVLKAMEVKSALNSYLAIFEGKSSYSGTGKAINITTYTDTTERQWVEKYCKKHNMQGWEEVCLAICMTESGGKENSDNPMGVVSPNGNYVTGFYSGTTESGIDKGVKALYDCAGIYEYFIGKKADPTDTNCILIVVSCYEQGIDFARFVSAHYKGKYSDKALDEYAIEKNNEGANNMFFGSYCLNGSDGTDTLGGRTVPPIYNNFLHFFDLTKSQSKSSSNDDDNFFTKLLNFFTSSGSSSAMGDIAMAELGNYGDKYWSWCHSGQVDWCGIFVSWCAEQAGLSDEIPFSMSAGMIDNLDQSKVKDESYTPKAGDLITFDDTPPYKVSHIAIVSRVEGGRVYYIGGNQGEGDSSRNTGAWCSYSIVSESSIPIGDSGVYKYYAFD